MPPLTHVLRSRFQLALYVQANTAPTGALTYHVVQWQAPFASGNNTNRICTARDSPPPLARRVSECRTPLSLRLTFHSPCFGSHETCLQQEACHTATKRWDPENHSLDLSVVSYVIFLPDGLTRN